MTGLPAVRLIALHATRQLLKSRTSTLVVATIFTVLPLTFAFNGTTVTFLLIRDAQSSESRAVNGMRLSREVLTARTRGEAPPPIRYSTMELAEIDTMVLLKSIRERYAVDSDRRVLVWFAPVENLRKHE